MAKPKKKKKGSRGAKPSSKSGKTGGRPAARKKTPKARAPKRRVRAASGAQPQPRGFARGFGLTGAAAPLRIDIATFNTHGAVDKSGVVQAQVAQYLTQQAPAIICFQELFFEGEVLALDAELLGPNVVRDGAGDIEIARGDGLYAARVGTTPISIGGAGAGIAIYTSLPIENARFLRFDGLQIPDSLSVKGIVGVEVTVDGTSFVVVNTHFNDDENDRVDGRARRANVRKLGEFLADAADRRIVVVGDFNLDSSATGGLDAVIFRDLLATAGRTWLEAGMENGRLNGLARPVPTLLGGTRTVDLMLLSGIDGSMPSLVADTYLARDAFGSDHRLVRATLEFA
jgi:endonuclease/exonuclease/phosphatase family metal-dependent hydrolase